MPHTTPGILSIFDLAALLLTLSAVFAWLNHKLFDLPNTIGVLLMGLFSSLVLIGVELTTHIALYDTLTNAIRQIDFTTALMNGMLAFLLFAGALHVDFSRLKNRAFPIGFLATAGVMISTAVCGLGIYYLARLFGTPIAFSWALVFGALISPTDPVAVLNTLKGANLPPTLEIEIAGESLFNDGVGIVLFTILVAIAGAGNDFTLFRIGELFFLEALGGALLGLVTGYIAYRAMAALDDYPIETLISIALVTGTYALAGRLHVSGPIAVVCAGLLIGERGPIHAMSDQTQRYLFGFWTLIDEILNSVLFLLIGLEVLVLNFDLGLAPIALAAIPLVLLARFISVALPAPLLALVIKLTPGAIRILTWAGVRGGISVALALSLPESDAKPLILAATYAVVLFTLIVQGLTLAPLARRLFGDNPKAATPNSMP